jgi:hypothetical protein
MSTTIRVVLNMSRLTVPEKINKAQMVHDKIFANPTSFPAPGNLLTDLLGAIVALRTAYANAADGGKTLIALMRNKESDLLDVMRQVGAYVEKFTRADAGRAAEAGLEVRQTANREMPEFDAKRGPDPGSVSLRARARRGVLYKWQYSLGTATTLNWVDALASHVSHVVVNGLVPNFYWFRVVQVDEGGEYAGAPIRVAVN